MARHAGWAAYLLLGAACAGGSAGGGPAPAAPRPATPPPATGEVNSTPLPGHPAPGRDALRYPRSGSGRLRYAFLRRDSIVVTMPSGEEQLQQTASTAWLTLTWTAADSGTRLEAVVDSIASDPDFPVPPAQLDSARRAQWAFRQAPDGEITGIVGQPPAFRAEQLRDQFLLLYPILPPGGAAAGVEWRDSTTAPTRVSAFSAEAHILLASRAEAAAGNGLHIVTARARTATGQETQFGQAISVRATGTDSVTTDLDANGRVVEATVRRVTDLVVDLAAIGQTVPAREVSFLRMTLLH